MKRVLCSLICVLFCLCGCTYGQGWGRTQCHDYMTKYVTNAETTPLRTEASNKGEVVCYIAEGEALSFVENDANGYAHVMYEGNEGYVLAAHLTNEKPQTEAEEKTIVVKEKVVEYVESAPAETENAAASADGMSEKEIEEYVSKHVRPTYNNINKLAETLGKVVEDGVSYWVNEEGVTIKVEIPKGTFGYDMSRQYYYDVNTGELLFAFVFKGKEEYRLYYKDGILVRYIDPEGTVYNNPTGEDALAMAQRCYKEGNINY